MPRLRFPEFGNEYQKILLDEIAYKIVRNDESSNAPVMMISAASGFIYQSEKYSRDNAGKSLKKYTLLKKGELAYNHGASKLKQYGCCFELLVDEARMPYVYHTFKISEKQHTPYIALLLNNPIIDRQLKKLVSSSVRMDGLLNISYGEYTSITLNLPSYAEQQKIASFLTLLDKRIAKQRELVESLKSYKRGLLSRLFPRKGETTPRHRFAGFTDAWEQYKLGQMCSEFQSGDFISADRITQDDVYPVFGGNGLRGYTSRYNHDGVYALIGRQGALCGNMNISYGKAYFTEHAVAVAANSSHDTEFLFYLFGILNLGQYSGQSAQPGLAVSKLITVSASTPKLNEQRQISGLLLKFDRLITLHQRKLNEFETVKTGMLQQLFI